MVYNITMTRILHYVAEHDGKIEDNLKRFGYSTRIITGLKQQFGLVAVNGLPRFLVDKIERGDNITVYLIEDGQDIEPHNVPIEFVYEDEDLAIINKSPNIAVMSTSAHYGSSLMNALAAVWGKYVYHPVNRLDKGTSGLMIVAKHALAHSILSEGIARDKQKAVSRKYYALVHGKVTEDVTINEPIGMPYETTLIRGIDRVNGKQALTFCRPIEIIGDYTLVKLELATGRTHQIRVHMSHIGHPLVGDDLYGGDNSLIAHPCLHSYSIKFIHPITGVLIEKCMPLPQDIEDVISTIRGQLQ